MVHFDETGFRTDDGSPGSTVRRRGFRPGDRYNTKRGMDGMKAAVMLPLFRDIAVVQTGASLDKA